MLSRVTRRYCGSSSVRMTPMMIDRSTRQFWRRLAPHNCPASRYCAGSPVTGGRHAVMESFAGSRATFRSSSKSLTARKRSMLGFPFFAACCAAASSPLRMFASWTAVRCRPRISGAHLRTTPAGGRWCLPSGTTVLACGPSALSEDCATKRTSAPIVSWSNALPATLLRWK
jgi:hypothetical protein